MTTTPPAPMPGYASDSSAAAPGWAGVPTPGTVQQGLGPAPVQRRLDPAQVWTLVVTGVIAVVALVVGLVASGSDGPTREEQIRDALNDAGIPSNYYDYYDDSDYYGSDCDSVFC